MEEVDKFWVNDLEILYKRERLTEFFPTKDQTTEERLNAIMRFCIYISILLYLHNKDSRYIMISVGFGLFSIFIYMGTRKKCKEKEKVKEGMEENVEEKCTAPTIDNPFMNVTMKDYLNIKDGRIVDRPPACDTTNVKTKKEMDEAFNNNLYKDVDDVFEKFNSQRQFYTMPSTTIPNRQDEFARWLYKNPKTCKEDQDYCLKYEDVRQSRRV